MQNKGNLQHVCHIVHDMMQELIPKTKRYKTFY